MILLSLQKLLTFRSILQSPSSTATYSCRNCLETRHAARDDYPLTPVWGSTAGVWNPAASVQDPLTPVLNPIPAQAEAVARDSLQESAVSEEHWGYVADFYKRLSQIKREECTVYNENWYNLKVENSVCGRCCQRAKNSQPPLFTAANHLEVGTVPPHLPQLTQIEEQLIA